MIQIKGLTKFFRSGDIETMALNVRSLNVNAGEFVAVTGPSGSGKSTLLNIIGLLDTASEGTYLFNGSDVSLFNERQRAVVRKANIGFVFQNFNLIDELTVYENIELPLLYLNLDNKACEEKVNRLMEELGIAHRRHHFPTQLSGGQRQRVAIARSMVTEPKLILADEPTGNLDSRNGTDVMKLLASLSESGTAIIMVTHSIRDAVYAARTIHMQDGEILQETMRSETNEFTGK